MARWWPWGGSGTGPEPVDAPSVPAPAPAPVQRAWQSLPPMTPALSPTRPIAPLDAFTSSLATQRDPSFLAPLGHIVDPDGPGGHVDGLAGPVVPQTVSSGPDLPVAPPKRPSIASTVQRLIEPRVRFSDPSASATAAAQVSAESATPAPTVAVARSMAEPDQEPATGHAELVETGFGGVAREVEPVSWSLPAVPAGAPAVRTAPLVSAPRQEPVTTLPVVAAPAPAVQRAPAGPDRAAAGPDRSTVAGDVRGDIAGGAPSTAPDGMSTAPLTGDATVPTVSRMAADPSGAESVSATGSAIDAGPDAEAGARGATRSTPSPDPMPVARPDPGGPAARIQRTIAESADGPARFPEAVSGPPAVADQGEPGDVAATVPGEATGSPSYAAFPAPEPALPVVPTLSAPSARLAVTGSSAGSSVQRQTDSTAVASATDGPGPRSSGLGAPLTAVPARGHETVVREPQAMDFASIQRIIESAAATGSTEITLPTASPAGSDRPRVAPTVGMPAPRPVAGGSRPTGLGAPLTSGVRPAGVQRTVAEPAPPPVASTPEYPVQRAADGVARLSSTGPVPTGPVPTPPAVPTGPVPTAPVPTGPAVDHLAPVPEAERAPEPVTGTAGADPLVVPTLGADTAPPSASTGEMSDAEDARPLPELTLAGATPVQRLADGPAPRAPLMMAPLLGDTSPYRPTPTHPAIPASPGVSAGPVLPAVQRFGIPGASSLVNKATSTVGGLTKSAQDAAGGLAKGAGGYADQARQAAGGYLSQAQGAAGGLMDSARGYADRAQGAAGGLMDSARGYADRAQGAAGGLMDSARGYADRAQGAAGGLADSAGGYLSQAQGAAGGLADSASGYLRSARGAADSATQAAGGAVDSAVGSASSAAGGAANQFAGAASGAVDQASGAVGQATGALGQAASGAADAVTGAAGGAMHAATGAIGAATGAAGAAAAGAAGAATDALPTNLDELARRLFDPLSARLKSELWMDRERAGMVTDLRR